MPRSWQRLHPEWHFTTQVGSACMHHTPPLRLEACRQMCLILPSPGPSINDSQDTLLVVDSPKKRQSK